MPSSRFIFGTLPWYSVLILCGMVCAIWLCSLEEKRLSLAKDTTVDLALRVIPFGIIGARLYYVVFSWNMFWRDPLSILMFWRGGLAIYGGIIGGILTIFIFARRRKLSPGLLLDCIAPGLALAQSIGRWGNFFNMEAFGLPITDPRFQFFPIAVLIPHGLGDTWHMATFFYESLWDLIVFIILWTTRRRRRKCGDGMLWYLLLYGSGRMMIEPLRMDSLVFGSNTFRISALLSLAMVTVVTILYFLRAYRAEKLFNQARQLYHTVSFWLVAYPIVLVMILFFAILWHAFTPGLSAMIMTALYGIVSIVFASAFYHSL